MSTKVAFESLEHSKKYNHRAGDNADPKHEEGIAALARSILRVGAYRALDVVPGTKLKGETEVETNRVSDGDRRFRALKLIKKEHPEDFDKLCPNGKVEVNLVADDVDAARRRGIEFNTHSEGLTPRQQYLEVLKYAKKEKVDGVSTVTNQYDIAELLNIQQPRVAEFLSFEEKLIEAAHTAWEEGILAPRDLVKLAALSEDKQKQAVADFRAAHKAAGKNAKAGVRKALKASAAESGNVRQYANAGAPSRQKISTFAKTSYSLAHTAKTAAERTFHNAIAAAFKVVSGQLSFDKLDPSKDYVSAKEAKDAAAFLEEQAAKAEKKAERAKNKAKRARKAEKAAQKAEAGEDAPKKAKKADTGEAKPKKVAKKDKTAKKVKSVKKAKAKNAAAATGGE